MSLLPENASFEEKVQDCFSAYRGRGVELSPLDAEVLEGWAASGAPFEVVARGLRRAAERAAWDALESGGALKTLRGCRREVESEIKKWASRTAGQHEAPAPAAEPLHATRHKKLLDALRKIGRSVPEVAGPARRLERRLPVPEDFTAAVRQEDLVLACFVRALPWQARQPLLQQARRLVENAQPISTSARLESKRFHRAAALKRRLELPPFW